ncbi:LOW QUALITY PROTEIN: fibrous sheath CABYR-binding protein [Sorex araneus]|uniref:LOW QUALITY PROTEIN: fibrous sheath CABYR-binding protein n=1 Tax=Sorex araneus TaxID=42254 RepID=UPI0024336D9E|nr:LOW QUALITY PROTEIN: fibrous sheath CABYR-binding protein [Sorex araneus]
MVPSSVPHDRLVQPSRSSSIGEVAQRRQPSQPLVEKFVQTETEKRKHIPLVQSSDPKSTLSNDKIPGSKFKIETNKLSSQIKKNGQRKIGQKKVDASQQTNNMEKEKEVESVGETLVPEEKPVTVGKAQEFPESVHEVEKKQTVQLKRDRSQQTSCTVFLVIIYNPQLEKLDKRQQTFFTESELEIIGRPYYLSRSKEDIQKSSGTYFISENPQF